MDAPEDSTSFGSRSLYDNANSQIVDLYENEVRILDVGCSTGLLGKTLKSLNGRAVVHGIDVSPAAAAAAPNNLAAFYALDLDHDPLPSFSEPFDLIVAGDVLEHLRRPDLLLRELAGVMTKEGALIVSVPNVAHCRSRLRLLAGRFEFTETGIMDRTHLRFFTQDSIKELLDSSGFQIVSERYIFSPRPGRVASWVPSRLRAAYGRLLAIQFVYKARKR